MCEGNTHENHPEWKYHDRVTNPRKFFSPTFLLSGLTVKERHDEEPAGWGFVNEYVYTREDGRAMTVLNAYASRGWRDGLWEVIYGNDEYCHLTDAEVERYLYKFMRSEI